MNQKMFSIQQILIATNGAELRKQLAPRESSSRQNIMMAFVCGQASIQPTLFAKASGKWKGRCVERTFNCMQKIWIEIRRVHFSLGSQSSKVWHTRIQ